MKKIITLSLFVAAIGLMAFYIPKNENKNEPKIGLRIGNKAPDLSFKSPDGKTYKLSDLKGKIVLVDFWASWCRPCRMENPNLVQVYNKYKKAKFKKANGFEIYSASLDKSMDSWKAAIKKDGLVWKYHVSDLGGWASAPARTYNVRSIPTSFLINQDGIIVGKNLRGLQLHTAIDEHVEKL